MFKDRVEAGRELAEKLRQELSSDKLKRAIILAIPRGGIVVGSEISKSLHVPLDCILAKKIPSVQSEELAIGAVGEEGLVVWEKELCERLNIPVEYQQEIVKKKLFELEEKKNFFRGGKPLPDLKGKTVIIVDDGVATGATVKVTVAVVENFSPGEIVLAVPVIARETLAEIKERVGRVVYLEAPEMFFSVGQFYENFEQVTDEKVREILE